MASKLAKVVITLDGSKVEVGLDKIRSKVVQLTNEMDKLAREGKQNTKEYKDRLKAVNKLHKAEMDVADVTQRINTYMKNLGNVATTDLRRAYREGVQLREGFKGTDAELKKLNADLAAMKAQIDANTGAVNRSKTAWSTLGTTIKNLFAYAGIFVGFNMLKSKMMEAYEANKKFSDSMANVRKVSGLAMEDIAKLANNLSQVDSRTSLSGLMELSYTGAKLGFGNYGIEGLESFARSAVKVQNALSEDMQGDAMTALSKLVEVMGLIPKMGVERAMDAAGSAIFKLASTSTATGTNIIEFTKRLMGLANVSHVTTAELLALGSASDSMGLMAEVSATAFNKVFTSIQSNTTAIEKALKFTKGELIDLVNQGRTMDAIVAVFEKMHGMSMDQLKNQGVFKALGSDGARLNNVMITMANRVDMLREHLQTSNQAFEEGTAVAQEYAIQMDTAAAYSERAANIWEKAFVNPKGVDVVKDFTKAWYNMSRTLTENQTFMLSAKVFLTGLLGVLKLLVSIIPALGFATVARGISAVWTAMQGATIATQGFRAAWMGLSASMKANWISLAIGGLMQLGMYLYSLREGLKQTADDAKKLKSDLSELNMEHAKAEGELRRYRRAIDEANTGSKQRAAAIAQFNSKFKPYLSNLLTEKSTAQDVANAYNEVNKAMRTKLALQLKEKDINDQVLPREQWTAQRREEYERSVRGTSNSQYGATWLTGYAQDNAKKSIQDIARDLNNRIFKTTESTFNSVLSQLGSGTLNELVRTRRKVNGQTVIDESVMGPQGRQLWSALRYILQDRAASTAMSRVNQKWKPEQDAMDAMIAAQQKEEPITPIDETRLTKEELRELAKQDAEAKQAARKELKDAETETNAIIAKVEEWYTLQQTAVTEAYNEGRITEQKMNTLNQQLEQGKNTALAAARRSLSGQDTQTWNSVKAQIGELMFDQGEWSKELLSEIFETNMKALRNALMKFDGKKSLDQWGFTSTAFRDSLNKNAAKNDAKVKEIDAKMRKEVEAFLLQYDYINQAFKSFSTQLENLGILTETAKQMAEKMRRATDLNPSYSEKDFAAEQQNQEQMRRKALSAFIAQGSKPYGVNPQDTNELNDWLRDFTGAEFGGIGENGIEFKFNSWAQTFSADFNLWLKDSEKYKDKIQEFFMSLLTAEEGYYKKRKEAYNAAKTHLDQSMQAAGWTDKYNEAETELGGLASIRKINGDGTNFLQQHGLQDVMAEDPEIKAIQLRIAMRQKEYEEAKALGESQQLIAEKQNEMLAAQADLAEKVGNGIAERISKLQELTAPLEEFGEEVGQKLGDALFSLESTSDTWSDITKKMILSVSKMTLQMGSQYLQQQLQQALTNKAMEAQEQIHQQTMTGITVAGGMARVVAEETTNAEILTATDIADSMRISKEAKVAAIMAAFGVSEGAAKTIAALGFWGIPLIGVITSVLMGLLSSALSTAGKSDDSGSATKVKLVSGMLTYDQGNVRTILGDDGRVYRAKEEDSIHTGIVSQPIATTVNGQPALVGERGPELVVGRETTRAIAMNEPELLQRIIDYDKYRSGAAVKAYAGGNVEEVFNTSTPSPSSGGGENGLDGETVAALKALPGVLAALNGELAKGINARVQKFGDGSLDEGMREINAFRKKYPA